jgi:hypothetical protein
MKVLLLRCWPFPSVKVECAVCRFPSFAFDDRAGRF